MRIYSLVFILTGSAIALSQAPPPVPPYMNPDLPPEVRARDLVSRMTLDQKVRQMQNAAPAIPELNVAQYDWWNEGLHGVARAGQATVFPQAIGLAATWDTDLMFRVADVISTEARAKYNEAIRQNNHGRYYGLTFWSPNINIFRDPRWGRGQETYGEDPFLTGRMAVAFIKGMQGNDPKYFKVVATAKHFAVHSGPEPSRHSDNFNPSSRDLNETYLPAFRAAMTEGKAYSLMCAYNSVSGSPACANEDLMVKTLRGEWKFQGYIVSDCGAIRDIYNGHRYKPNAMEASAIAVKMGTDLTCGNEYAGAAGGPFSAGALVSAVQNGLITEGEINRSVERLFIARIKLGMFDPPERVPFSKIPYSVNDSEAHRKLALEAARKSIVLLKNENLILPLKASVRKIAVLGPSADDPVALLGNYNGFSQRIVPPLEGIQKQFAGKAEVRFALGATYVPSAQALISSEVLTPPSGQGVGVLAEYFDNADLRNAAKFQRVEARPYLPSITDPILTSRGIPERGFSVRWTGMLKAPFSGEFVMGVRGGGQGVQLFVDDRDILAPVAQGRGNAARQASIPLEEGKMYRLRMEYRHSGNAAAGNIQLFWAPPSEPLLAEAVNAVRNSDVAIAFLGLNPSLEGEEMTVNVPGFRGGDRTDLNLPADQQRLLEAILATGKPVVVVLTSGSAVAITTATEKAAGVIAAWYGGEEIGTAIAETLSGQNNPAGRLPVTFYKSVQQLPPFEDYSMRNRTYRYFKGDVLYPFGHGLSYSTFEYSRLMMQRIGIGLRVRARVKNTSNREGDDVVQLYVEGAGGPEDSIRDLRGFRRVHLKAGETAEVEFNIDSFPLKRTRIGIGGGQPSRDVYPLEGLF
jgi:beta-glucosidase